MPAWPIGVSYTKGLLGIDQRTTVAESLKQAQLERSAWTKRIETESFGNIQSDPKLMTIVRQTGRELFGDNCAACHGTDARGGRGFPNLTTTSWLWGGTPEALAETIRVGINSPHPDSRASQMPAFGRDQILPRCRHRECRQLCTDSLRSCRVKGRAGREDKSRPSSLRGQLCLLSWRRRSWQHGDRRAKPYRQVLDLWRRCADHRHHGSGTAVRATCRLGKVDCRRSTARFSLSTSSI